MRLPVRLSGATLCAVVGTPIAHSRSPLIHRLFAEQFGIALQYERVEVGPGALAEALERLRDLGCRGVNVTVPLKEEAASIALEQTACVELAGAANTLWWTDANLLAADNTDGTGLLNDLTRNWGLNLAGKRLLILGAGGAAAGVIAPLLAAKPAILQIINRDQARAEALVERFQTLGPLCVVSNSALASVPDLLINATSAGVQQAVPEFPPGTVAATTYCYDMFYATGETPFLRHVHQLGAVHVRDGFGMLVEQAAASFQRWHGVCPDTGAVMTGLRPYRAAEKTHKFEFGA